MTKEWSVSSLRAELAESGYLTPAQVQLNEPRRSPRRSCGTIACSVSVRQHSISGRTPIAAARPHSSRTIPSWADHARAGAAGRDCPLRDATTQQLPEWRSPAGQPVPACHGSAGGNRDPAAGTSSWWTDRRATTTAKPGRMKSIYAASRLVAAGRTPFSSTIANGPRNRRSLRDIWATTASSPSRRAGPCSGATHSRLGVPERHCLCAGIIARKAAATRPFQSRSRYLVIFSAIHWNSPARLTSSVTTR